MKEKEVDVYLSLKSLCHLMMLGSGGAFAGELFANISRSNAIYPTAFVFIELGITLVCIYPIIFSRINRKN